MERGRELRHGLGGQLQTTASLYILKVNYKLQITSTLLILYSQDKIVNTKLSIITSTLLPLMVNVQDDSAVNRQSNSLRKSGPSPERAMAASSPRRKEERRKRRISQLGAAIVEQ